MTDSIDLCAHSIDSLSDLRPMPDHVYDFANCLVDVEVPGRRPQVVTSSDQILSCSKL